jgi:hypothetical protein
MERRLGRIHEHMRERGLHTLNPRHVPASEAGAGYPDGLTTPPRVRWRAGLAGRLQLRAQRPVAEWVHAYLEHQSAIDTQMFDRLASLDARVREVAATISEQQQARHAEMLAVLRQLGVELASLRGESAARPDPQGARLADHDRLGRGETHPPN